MENKLTFGNVNPHDLSWLTREQIVDIICNTFDSKVVDSDIDRTVIKSNWHVLDKDAKYLLGDKDAKANVYFYLVHENFIILRGATPELITNTVKEVLKKEPLLIDSKEGNYLNGNHYSTILYGREFYRILFSTALIKKGCEHVTIKGKFHYINNMGCDVDPTIEDITMAYCSDLHIGVRVHMSKK